MLLSAVLKRSLGKLIWVNLYFWISFSRSSTNSNLKMISRTVLRWRETIIRAPTTTWILLPRKKCLRTLKCPRSRCKDIWAVRMRLNSQRNLRKIAPYNKAVALWRSQLRLRLLNSRISKMHMVAAISCIRNLWFWKKCPCSVYRPFNRRVLTASNHLEQVYFNSPIIRDFRRI